MKPFSKTALIIGAGPAGLTAAYELLKQSDIKPIIVDNQNVIGGISATHNYKNNRIDIGGHRFYSKDEFIVKWWKEILPLQSSPSIDEIILNRNNSHLYDLHGNDPEKNDDVMLIRPRLSRIYFDRKLFNYPLDPSFDTFRKLGLQLSISLGIDYLLNRLHPISPEKNLEDFFINRFGKKLYETFFCNYTEKVWGIPCKQISKEWGSQRVRGVSVSELIKHALFNIKSNSQKVQTSLISQFYYPKYGPGQLWEQVALKIKSLGGEIHICSTVDKLHLENSTITKADLIIEGQKITMIPDLVLSSAPIKDLISAFSCLPNKDIRSISDNLVYRDFIMTGILSKTMSKGVFNPVFPDVCLLPDTWIYIQEPEMISGRLQIYNNWSPYMVANRNTVWIGLEFFCNEGDSLWSRSESQMIQLASDELAKMNLVSAPDIIDGTSIKIKKAYPAYFGSFTKLHILKDYLCSISNLFCIGRNGMHRYNNMDHSMLTAISSVKSITGKNVSKKQIWEINSEHTYGEQK